MPAKKGTSGKAAGRGRYQKTSLSPTRGNASPKKGRGDQDDSKDMAVIMEKERKAAKKAMRDFAEQIGESEHDATHHQLRQAHKLPTREESKSRRELQPPFLIEDDERDVRVYV